MEKERFRVKTILIILAAMALLLTGCDRSALQTEKPSPDAGSLSMRPEPSDAAATPTQEAEMKGNLMAWAETQADAENIANLYGINLVAYSNKIALFYTDQDLDALIQTGKKNGWPELSKNNPVTITQP